MNITEFFDPHDPKHIKAYRHLEETGYWPKGFVPAETEMLANWQIALVAKMANCWVEYQLQIARGDRW